MSSSQEVEIKFLVADLSSLETGLRDLGFQQKTPPTHEMNTLYDTEGLRLRNRGEILRIRKYGENWKFTHKSKGDSGRHKSRVEQETTVGDGAILDSILQFLGFTPTFIYEKYRSEWMDGQGEVVLDRTPIGDFAEIEGTPEWIDRTAGTLGVSEKDYITKSYAELFLEWKRRTNSYAQHMTFAECGVKVPIGD